MHHLGGSALKITLLIAQKDGINNCSVSKPHQTIGWRVLINICEPYIAPMSISDSLNIKLSNENVPVSGEWE